MTVSAIRRQQFFHLHLPKHSSSLFLVYESGDDITPCLADKKRTLFLSNHLSPEDICLTIDFFNSRTIRDVMWVSFEPIKFSPMGLVLNIRGDFFLKQVNSVIFPSYMFV